MSRGVRGRAFTTGISPRYCAKAAAPHAVLGCFATSEGNEFKGTAPEADFAAKPAVLLAVAPLRTLRNER